MEIGYAVLLGVIQGLTEFLPVSSSGHLVLFQNWFGFKEPQIFFDVSLHVGTLIAICVFFFSDLKAMAQAVFSGSTWSPENTALWEGLCRKEETRLMGLIFVGTIPTVVIGLMIRPVAEKLFSSVFLVGVMLVVTGLLLWLTRRVKKGGRTAGQMTVRDALCVGAIQGAAIFPGISRSGATIAMGLFSGLDRETAARFSFLLSIPAILGAMIHELHEGVASGFPPLSSVLLGTAVAAVVGYAALSILIHLVKRGNLYTFAPYCWLVGVLVIVGSL